jgi:hypothetical protein
MPLPARLLVLGSVPCLALIGAIAALAWSRDRRSRI